MADTKGGLAHHPTSSPSPTGSTASTRLSAVSSSDERPLLDQHLALAAAAYEQRHRSQGDDQPRRARGEDAHGGDALVRCAQPGAGLPAIVDSPVERGPDCLPGAGPR